MSWPFSQPIRMVGHRISDLERYWNDPSFRLQCERETTEMQRDASESIDRHMIEKGIRWPMDWTDEEKQSATDALLKQYQSQGERK